MLNRGSNRNMIKLSPYHEMFYNEWKLSPARSDYNIVFDNDLSGEIEVDRLDKAVKRLFESYFLLHSGIVEKDNGCYWVAKKSSSITVDFFDSRRSETELLAYVTAPFDLATGPFFRICLIKLTDAHFRLIIVCHHIIMDGGKIDFIFEQIPRYYNDPKYQFELSLAEQCKKLDEVSRQLETRLQKTEKNHRQFWVEQLRDLHGPDLRFLQANAKQALPKPANGDNPIGEHLFTLSTELLEKLQRLRKQYTTTPYLLSQAVFAMTLYLHTRQKRMGLCFLVALAEGQDFIYGVHVSPTVLPYQFNHEMTLIELLTSNKQFFKACKTGRHHYFPIQKLLSTVVHKDTVEVAFTQTNLKDRTFDFDGTFNASVNSTFNIDLAGTLLFAQEIRDDGIRYRVTYQKHCIDADLLARFISTYQRLLAEVVDDLLNHKGNKRVTEYSALDTTQRQLLTVDWNKTQRAYPQETLTQLFEAQVSKTPTATAIVYEDMTLSYEALNKIANQLAHYLRKSYHINPDDLIILCLKPDQYQIIALLAVLKSGAAYVPIDPAYPDARITHIAKDTQAKLFITNQDCDRRFQCLFATQVMPQISIDDQPLLRQLTQQVTTNPLPQSKPHHLAYVIYTSGTTGQPKGVLIEHRSVVNHVSFLIRHRQLSQASVGAKCVSFGFDTSVSEIYPILLAGGKLCILNEQDRLDCNKVNDFFHQHGVNYAFLTTAFAQLFFALPNTSLKDLIVGGDKLTQFPTQSYRVMNLYGPTETTVQSTGYMLSQDHRVISIGKPIDNTTCYVVDNDLNLVPIGAIGELLVGGVGLARGYLNLPEVTATKFIANPFQTDTEKKHHKNERLYKTGDLVRWLPDGNLAYIGRNDDQVQLNGHRVELEDIENNLLPYPGIKQVVVVLIEKGLVAYYLSDSPINHVDLQQYLLKRLPAYMQPASFMHISQLPLTQNGKLDKHLLPKPCCKVAVAYVSPQNALETKVCRAYAQILGIDDTEVGVNHDFFALGGNSLLAIQLTMKLNAYFKILVTDIVELRTPARLASNLAWSKGKLDQKIEKIKQIYVKKITFALRDMMLKTQNVAIIRTQNNYLQRARQQQVDGSKRKKINMVLLTGSNGYLGCHLLEKLLSETAYTIYLPIRAASNEAAFNRLNQKFKFYFAKNLNHYTDRIVVMAADIGKTKLGLDTIPYERLVSEVDSIIHCAALVKYYGHEAEFYQANVQPTKHLLELSSLTRHRDFHYISTVGVLLNGHVENQDYWIFTEEDDLDNLIRGNHPYLRSKDIAERLVQQYQKKGVSANIYRVGNQAMHSASHHIQENFEENIFFAHIQAMLKFKIIPQEIANMEVSPVDYTAAAIVKLFDKQQLSNQTHHVFNPNVCNLQKTLIGYGNGWWEDFNTLINKTLVSIDSYGADNKDSSLLMLYQFWLQEADNSHATHIRIAQDKTEEILRKLGFLWITITPEMLSQFIKPIQDIAA